MEVPGKMALSLRKSRGRTTIVLALIFFVMIVLTALSFSEAGATTQRVDLVYALEDDLYWVDLILDLSVQLTDTAEVAESYPAISPDRTRVAYTMGDAKIGISFGPVAVYDVRNSTSEVIACAGDFCSNPQWSPDGRYLVYMRAISHPISHTYGAWEMVNVDTGEVSKLLVADIWTDGRSGWWSESGLFTAFYYYLPPGSRPGTGEYFVSAFAGTEEFIKIPANDLESYPSLQPPAEEWYVAESSVCNEKGCDWLRAVYRGNEFIYQVPLGATWHDLLGPQS